MALGGFTCSKNTLIVLNILYILVGFILIGVAAYCQRLNLVTSIAVVSWIIACGVFLILLAILGLVAAVKHHQVMLFFFMTILFVLFVLQFSIACACLAMTSNQQELLAREGWAQASDDLKASVQTKFGCCGFNKKYLNQTEDNKAMSHPSCKQVPSCCPDKHADQCCTNESDCFCNQCYEQLKDAISYGLSATGGIGLFFSFTEFIGVFLTIRYRNQKDPRGDPNHFI